MNTTTKTNSGLNGLINDVLNMGFDRFFSDGVVTNGISAHTPVNITETDNAFELELVAPGREKSDFQVQLNDQLLTVSYEKKPETENAQRKTVRREFKLEGFKRTFTINEKVDATAISASYVNGILKLVLPKKEEVKATPATIAVQ
ncbi:MAG: Hsp20/alpha crystallin family protein [Dinghuibacter sp.]|nr:Hsp20/alpha crystallin family protein [Dinghuibacter sp.]